MEQVSIVEQFDSNVAKLSHDDYQLFFTEAEAAKYLRVSVKFLQTCRWKGGGPVFRKFSRLVRYHIDDLKKYADACAYTSTGKESKSHE
ncbi:helix-turn-helix domain-containing protein [bacterium]|nr:helix-turn-helix domain-containing protein [bacterium]